MCAWFGSRPFGHAAPVRLARRGGFSLPKSLHGGRGLAHHFVGEGVEGVHVRDAPAPGMAENRPRRFQAELPADFRAEGMAQTV